MKEIKSITLAVLVVMALLSLSAGLLYAEDQKEAPAAQAVAPAQVQAAAPAPAPKIDSGDTAWMIVATALVML